MLQIDKQDWFMVILNSEDLIHKISQEQTFNYIILSVNTFSIKFPENILYQYRMTHTVMGLINIKHSYL